ncbi:uncharacterized protein LOC129736158 isoform X2 [Falco cherrug]|uniref:uncharacterized protein LOC129736158 isoform X2 n=1 Tax=Falco cherrug TaxID=345164 RepID=UPI00247ADB57|nr:uncharacterized protein LOC129736158 isoform X2 [Falco cherrug]
MQSSETNCIQRTDTLGVQNKMSQTRRIPRRFAPSSYPDGAPEEETYSNLQTISGTTEQMEFNISSATQVGHQLALIGDEFNRTYNRKFEDTLLHLAHGVFQTWNIIRSVIRSFGNILNNNWTKRIIDYGSWICRLPFRCVCQKLVPAALLVVAFWWAMNYGLQN